MTLLICAGENGSALVSSDTLDMISAFVNTSLLSESSRSFTRLIATSRTRMDELGSFCLATPGASGTIWCHSAGGISAFHAGARSCGARSALGDMAYQPIPQLPAIRQFFFPYKWQVPRPSKTNEENVRRIKKRLEKRLSGYGRFPDVPKPARRM